MKVEDDTLYRNSEYEWVNKDSFLFSLAGYRNSDISRSFSKNIKNMAS